MMKRFAMAASLTLALAACQDESFTRSSTRHLTPIPAATMSLMAEKGMSKSDPILIRSYKKEAEMEVWKRGSNGRYALLKTYPICRWSGQLGPKVKEGDRQAPEGFYTVSAGQMNPNSAYYLSFDTGFPNAYDRSFGRSGSALMVHGSCSSRGCFAMTDQNIAEIYALARDAMASGQRGFQFQSYPFRMTAKNLAQHRMDPNIAFWKNLKEGSDYFEVTKDEPRVAVSERRYVFNMDPSAESAVAAKSQQDERAVAELVSGGTKPIRLVYHDGGSHESFRTAFANSTDGSGSLVVDARMRDRYGDVSRPEGLSSGPQEIAMDGSDSTKPAALPSTVLAYTAAKTAPVTAPASAPAAPEVKVAAAPAAVAPAAPAEAPASGSTGAPFYKRMFNGIGDLFSSSSVSQPETETAQVSPSVSEAPLPPQRGTVVKPQASAPTLQKRVQATSVTVAVAN
ncbi:L,D-transpeptidase family protein [Microvirga pudoricolor]|uniref:L,D-transpeptidase family protein n=1 Tax=Microvirga pudoricolor TaxID=2778729 RepID=UPI00194EAAF2|nr:murein L,D-transpeptidase family protein [Microvirga pudoricolor]MBM6593383.1 murein L,D-transpeptidase [Microvirga pudoricolor]